MCTDSCISRHLTRLCTQSVHVQRPVTTPSAAAIWCVAHQRMQELNTFWQLQARGGGETCRGESGGRHRGASCHRQVRCLCGTQDRMLACAQPASGCGAWGGMQAHRRHSLDLLKEHKQCSVGCAPGTQRFVASHWFKLGRFVRRSRRMCKWRRRCIRDDAVAHCCAFTCPTSPAGSSWSNCWRICGYRRRCTRTTRTQRCIKFLVFLQAIRGVAAGGCSDKGVCAIRATELSKLNIQCRQLVERLLEDVWIAEAVHQDDPDAMADMCVLDRAEIVKFEGEADHFQTAFAIALRPACKEVRIVTASSSGVLAHL